MKVNSIAKRIYIALIDLKPTTLRTPWLKYKEHPGIQIVTYWFSRCQNW